MTENLRKYFSNVFGDFKIKVSEEKNVYYIDITKTILFEFVRRENESSWVTYLDRDIEFNDLRGELLRRIKTVIESTNGLVLQHYQLPLDPENYGFAVQRDKETYFSAKFMVRKLKKNDIADVLKQINEEYLKNIYKVKELAKCMSGISKNNFKYVKQLHESTLNFKMFETIYIGKIDLDSYRFVYDPGTDTGWFNLDSKEDDEIYIVEIKKVDDGLHIFSPDNFDFDLNELTEQIVYILNKNRFGYKFVKKEVVDQRYGLKPYGIISINKDVSLKDLEKVVHSTKTINSRVKKGGDLDQNTF